jgi:hypothetical protein
VRRVRTCGMSWASHVGRKVSTGHAVGGVESQMSRREVPYTHARRIWAPSDTTVWDLTPTRQWPLEHLRD